MIGDPTDFLQRLRLTLPTRWFSDTSPVLEGVLSGFSAAWHMLYDLIKFVQDQGRIQSVSGDFLDLAASDFFNDSVRRRTFELDDAFRARLQRAMLRQRATRPALSDCAAVLGFSILVFEAARPADTGAYNVASSLAWGFAGGWGSYQMPLESLITAKRGPNAIEGQLWRDLADAVPAGGAAWLRIAD